MVHHKPEHSAAFRAWLNKPAGARFLNLETKVLDTIVPTLFGYDAIILGEPNFATCLQACTIRRKTVINQDFTTEPSIYARQDKLPILAESVDLVYLAHCLGFTNNPHEVLRETNRILRPDGHVIISMFNPLSLWGVWRHVARWGGNAPWMSNFMSLVKLKDWLALLGFDIMHINHFGYNLPTSKPDATAELSWLEKFAQKAALPCGAGYVIEASKRVIPLTPIRPVWSTEPEIIASDLAEPTT